MSKKLIAVAAAAALGLSVLAGAPAHASTLTFSVKGAAASGSVTTANTALTAVTHAAPEFNQLNYSDTDATNRISNTVVRFVVSGADKATATISAAGGVKVLTSLTDASGNVLKVGAGETALSASFATGSLDYTFYAYTTSTTAGTVSIASAGNTTVFHVASRAGTAYNLVATEFPTSIVADGATKAYVYTSISDVFGNLITDKNAADRTAVTTAAASQIAFTSTAGRMTLAAVGAAVTAAANTWTWDSVKSKWKSNIVTATTSGSVAFRVDLLTEDNEVGLAAPKNVAFNSVTSGSLTEQITTLTARVATLTAQVAALTADYNRLATRFNKRYDLKKAPVKKVALK